MAQVKYNSSNDKRHFQPLLAILFSLSLSLSVLFLSVLSTSNLLLLTVRPGSGQLGVSVQRNPSILGFRKHSANEYFQ